MGHRREQRRLFGGHELAQTFGRKHPEFCDGNSRDDTAYPYPNGQLSPNDGSHVGFDVGDSANGIPMRALPGVRWKDVMTYCEFQWLSRYTDTAIRDRLADEDAPGAGPGLAGAAAAGGKVMAGSLQVVATIDRANGVGAIVSVVPHQGAATALPPGRDSSVVVRDGRDGHADPPRRRPLSRHPGGCRRRQNGRAGHRRSRA